MTKTLKSWITVLGIVLAGIIVFNLLTFQCMTEHAVVTRFAKPQGGCRDADALKGSRAILALRISCIVEEKVFLQASFIDKVDYYNDRMLTYDVDSRSNHPGQEKGHPGQLCTVAHRQPRPLPCNHAHRITPPMCAWRIYLPQLNQHIGKIDAEVLISDKDHVGNAVRYRPPGQCRGQGLRHRNHRRAHQAHRPAPGEQRQHL